MTSASFLPSVPRGWPGHAHVLYRPKKRLCLLRGVVLPPVGARFIQTLFGGLLASGASTKAFRAASSCCAFNLTAESSRVFTAMG